MNELTPTAMLESVFTPDSKASESLDAFNNGDSFWDTIKEEDYQYSLVGISGKGIQPNEILATQQHGDAVCTIRLRFWEKLPDKFEFQVCFIVPNTEIRFTFPSYANPSCIIWQEDDKGGYTGIEFSNFQSNQINVDRYNAFPPHTRDQPNPLFDRSTTRQNGQSIQANGFDFHVEVARLKATIKVAKEEQSLFSVYFPTRLQENQTHALKKSLMIHAGWQNAFRCLSNFNFKRHSPQPQFSE